MNQTLPGIVAISLACVGGAAFAQLVPPDIPVNTQTMGATSPGVPPARALTAPGAGGYTAQQIAQSFLGADANRDGELTPLEARQLAIMPYPFEQVDQNKDGILSRFEYEDGVR